MVQLAPSLLFILALYFFATEKTGALTRGRKLEDTSTTIPSKTDFLDGLVDQILEQSRDVLVNEPPRIARQVSSTSEANWNPPDRNNQESGVMMKEAQELDDRHIHYDLIPGHEPSTSELPGLRSSQQQSTETPEKPRMDVTGSDANIDSDAKKEDPTRDIVSSTNEAGGRNSMARSINQQNGQLVPMKTAQQQLTRPPYAANDQFQMGSSSLNIPFANTNNKFDKLNHIDLSPDQLSGPMASGVQNVVPTNLDTERLNYSKDQLFSTLPSSNPVLNPSRAHNDRYTNEFNNIINTEMQSTRQMVVNQLQPKIQSETQDVGNFAASFVNITAPIVKPVSASEAMKVEIANSKKSAFMQHHHHQQQNQHHQHQNQQHHSSGYMRSPTPEPNRNIQHPSVPVSQYYMGAQFDEPLPIYSAPANQLLAHQLESPIVQQTIPSAGNDKDRRLEPQHSASFPPSPLTGRWPYGGAHNMTGHVHQASGFRSPVGWHQAASSDGYSTNSAILNVSPSTVATSIMNASYPQTRTPPSSGQPLPSPTVAPSGGGISPVNNNNNNTTTTTTTNGFITSGIQQTQQQFTEPSESMQPNPVRRLYNLTRVEHISAECSNDLIRTLIVFNGTFKGIIYSSGYVRDPNCMYINGTGKTRYEFSIKLNQCGTMSRQEVHTPSGTSDVSRQDKVMWNTLSIQYNPIVEQEWDEHFRVSCEYGSDFWKTVSFSPFNIETNTGAPIVFTVDPPQCQMEVLRGYGVMGPRQEAVSGPVTVGDPLTLLIHMRSEKAGYDILVKNCIAHNGGNQKMQLIDSNGCVVNERFISPFRGNYNDNELKHVTLYSFLKAFRFTGSPVLYLECEIHMCQNKCPPQMCYWRRLSKRSVAGTNDTTTHLPEPSNENYTKPLQAQQMGARRSGRNLRADATARANQISDKVSLFQALEVRHDVPGRGNDPNTAAYRSSDSYRLDAGIGDPLLCYRQVNVLGFLIAAGSIILVAVSVATCCWRATSAPMTGNLLAHQHQLNRNELFLGSEMNSPTNRQTAGCCVGAQRRVNLLNSSYRKGLDSMNPFRYHIATSNKERLLAAALQ